MDRLTDEQHSPMLLSIRKDRNLSFSFDDVVGRHVVRAANSLNAIACKALLLSVVVGSGHVRYRRGKKCVEVLIVRQEHFRCEHQRPLHEKEFICLPISRQSPLLHALPRFSSIGLFGTWGALRAIRNFPKARSTPPPPSTIAGPNA